MESLRLGPENVPAFWHVPDLVCVPQSGAVMYLGCVRLPRAAGEGKVFIPIDMTDSGTTVAR